jgi:hypothetical protein
MNYCSRNDECSAMPLLSIDEKHKVKGAWGHYLFDVSLRYAIGALAAGMMLVSVQ